ncbi:type I-C CRISPR-associated protein Cas8c/Csd1 [Moraxella equi]|uniref:CRISPR-associated protein Cas8c/Csd1, subtype I-C/DVULG n=1 Tax=Moraxella equi TaxID=60442 RepID=A0A378QNA8_9GAMM|nr:type I-C CRISPR-associated protein Cas8c/Csd1 [Moraxella equi]OPH38633.1 type I-C CRISPR-associated protein Cas8c/Csd1 [Moraxella equi]STZ02379.1 CRISPR-associated protein Cas8c/Csd1, subtype I-C/DVULG [Moraxella equi]
MSWIQKLYRTYEVISSQEAGFEGNSLTPIGHTLQTAHIEIVLNGNGEFQTARVMPAKTAIILPATETSENRTSGEAPHPLADKLQYVAKDYPNYGGEKKAYFAGYLAQLQAWCESPCANDKVKAVLAYVKKGEVIADLIKVGVLHLNADGNVLNKWDNESDAPAIFSVLPKTKGEIEFGSALVCWQVEVAGDPQSETWTDKAVQQSWIEYLALAGGQTGFCVVQGEEKPIANMHPAKLRHTGDKAKLISSNDTAGYTFRGRFELAEEAVSLSAEVSAKSHSALRWLIARQGIRNGDQVTVAWAIGGQEVPSPFFGENVIDHSEDLGEGAFKVIKKKYKGYKAKLQSHEQISLLMLDSATPGRMALTYYQEFLPDDYFANLDAWIDDFSWYQRHSIESKDGKKNEKRTVWAIMPPSPFAIANAVYGKSLSDTLKKQLYARLLPVIAGGNGIGFPYDLVQKSFQMACNPNGCEHWEWQRNIGVACALYRGYCARNLKRRHSMSLDIENRSRDYIFGRLLAMAENLERMALSMAGEIRATNAERYMQRFAISPNQTWTQLEQNLKTYKDRLRKDYPVRISDKFVLTNPLAFLIKRENEISELVAILDELKQAGCDLDKPLEPEFLLGYHSQKMAYRHKQDNHSEQNEQD